MEPDFSSIRSNSDQDDSSSFRPAVSASDMVQRRRARSSRLSAQTRRQIIRYAAYISCIGLFTGLAQVGVGLYYELPLATCVVFVVQDLCGAIVGAFVGLAGVCFLIISPILPLGPFIIFRIEPNIGDEEQWEDEARALRSAALLLATIGAAIASFILFVPPPVYRALATAGAIGAGCGIAAVIFLICFRNAEIRRDRQTGIETEDR